MYILPEVLKKQSNRESKKANQTCVISLLPRSPGINLLDLSSPFFQKNRKTNFSVDRKMLIPKEWLNFNNMFVTKKN